MFMSFKTEKQLQFVVRDSSLLDIGKEYELKKDDNVVSITKNEDKVAVHSYKFDGEKLESLTTIKGSLEYAQIIIHLDYTLDNLKNDYIIVSNILKDFLS